LGGRPEFNVPVLCPLPPLILGWWPFSARSIPSWLTVPQVTQLFYLGRQRRVFAGRGCVKISDSATRSEWGTRSAASWLMAGVRRLTKKMPPFLYPPPWSLPLDGSTEDSWPPHPFASPRDQCSVPFGGPQRTDRAAARPFITVPKSDCRWLGGQNYHPPSSFSSCPFATEGKGEGEHEEGGNPSLRAEGTLGSLMVSTARARPLLRAFPFGPIALPFCQFPFLWASRSASLGYLGYPSREGSRVCFVGAGLTSRKRVSLSFITLGHSPPVRVGFSRVYQLGNYFPTIAASSFYLQTVH
jgi:hypothetical protein